ncbi:catabolite repression protein creC [Panaeolus papilionaceus]|nr:catabolite repression protein creC [Panaeolus papilionaceus]
MENDSTFVAPEGVYSVTDEHKPNNVQNMAAAIGPPLFPSKALSIILKYPTTKAPATPAFAGLLGGSKEQKKEKSDKPSKDKDDGVSLSSSDTPDDTDPQASSQEPQSATSPQEPHPLFFHPSASNKRKGAARPRHNIKSSSSTFISRVQTAEGLARNLQSKLGEVTYLFYNLAKSFVWVEAGSKAKEPLTRITFVAHPTCHDINLTTASTDKLDVIIGFNTGDLIWFDPINSRYGRLNKQGSISSSPCTAVHWVPGSTTLFLASHADGTIIVYDIERDDGSFKSQDPSAPPSSTEPNPSSMIPGEAAENKEWSPTEDIFVTMPPWHPVATAASGNTAGKSDKEKTVKNPVSHWRISRKGVVDFVFSPDVKYVAAISEDGCLRVIDALAEQLVDCYSSYFGALTSVAWSPDGRFILTGGQDDLLTIFSPWEQRVVARCQGHSSFVSSVAFDDLRCDTRTYRFGSVGEDNKLILWDFSSGALHRPKLLASRYSTYHHQRMSMSSTLSLGFRRDRSQLAPSIISSPHLEGATASRYHPAPSRNEVAVVQPVLIKHLDCELLTTIQFHPRSVLTSTKNGHIRLWVRPLALRARHQKGRVLSPDAQDVSM